MDGYMQEERDNNPKFDKECARAELIVNLNEDINIRMEDSEISIRDLSKKSEIKVRRLKKILRGYSNFSLNELADICHALKLEPPRLALTKEA